MICFVASNPQIDRTDVTGMVDLLHNFTPGTAIDLMLHIPGGHIEAAEKLILLVRKPAGSAPVRVIVPENGKSAAILIALGAIARRLSCRTPTATSRPWLHRVTSTRSTCMRNGSRTNSKGAVAWRMLVKMEPAAVRQLERIRKRSLSIDKALLGQAMVRDVAHNRDRESI